MVAHSLGNTCGLQKNEAIKLLKLVLENCVFTFQVTFFKQLHRATMGSPCSPVVTNIYMEYFEDLALGLEAPIPIKEWKRYVDDVFSIIPKSKREIMLSISKFHWSTHKIHCRAAKQRGCYPLSGHISQTQWIRDWGPWVYRKPTHTDRYLDFNSDHPILAKRAVVRALMDRASNVCSSPDILAKEVEHLSKVLC